MNHWQTGVMPYSWHPKGVTMSWSGTDQPEALKKNPDAGAWAGVDISYEYNQHGFRTHELESLLGQKVNVALGCSFTEGIGLPVTDCWPSHITNYPMLNLGLGSGTTDTVARILTNISGLYDIQTAFILWPTNARFETYVVFNEGTSPKDLQARHHVKTVLPMTNRVEYTWALTDEMSEQRLNRNRCTVELLSKVFGFRVIQYTVNDIIAKFRSFGTVGLADNARDGSHWGSQTQRAISDLMQLTLNE